MSASLARTRVLSDHIVLRDLMRDLSSVAQEAVRDEKLRPRVRDILARLRTELERHLEYEETVLLPLLRDADAWGPVRVADLARDHAGHRAILVALTEDASEGVRSVQSLAEEIDWFVRSFARDMHEEEKMLLTEEALGEQSFVVDQIDGRSRANE